jgi:iron complex outermembrane receptor protein
VKRFFTICLTLLTLTSPAQSNLQFAAQTTASEVPDVSISGRILTNDGQPAANVTIQISGTQKVTLTDEQGSFAFTGLPDGRYNLLISMTGMQPVQRTVDVSKAAPATIDLKLSLNEKQLAEVVITSGFRLNDRTPSVGKAPIHPMDLPQAVTVVGAGLIRDQQAQRLSDVIRNVNGVYLTTTRGNVQESFSARGYALGSSNLFKNGARINSGSMPEMSALERVEVLKGASAILFGQVAPGGVVNMVTKEPRFKRGGEVSMRAGSYSLYKPAFDIYGPLSNSVAYRLNGTFESAGSFRDDVKSERYYVNPSFLFKLGKKTEFLFEADFLKHDFTPDFGIGTIGGTMIPDVPRSRFMGTPWQYSHTRQATATTTLRHRLNERWSLNASAGYQFYNRDYFATERVQADSAGDWTRPLGRVLTEENYNTAQTNLTGKVNTGNWEHTLLFGIEGDHYNTTAFTFAAANYDRINILNPTKYTARTDEPTEPARQWRTNALVDRFGIYAQDLVKLSDKWNVLAGLRASYVVTEGIDSVNVQDDRQRIGAARIDRALSPRLGVVYKPTDATSLFASYANSFNINTGNDIYGNSVKPSIIDQYELGVKNELFGGKLSANVTLYRIINNNLAQTAPFLLDGITANTNTAIRQLSGKTLSDGVEVDLGSSPVKGLDLRAGYSYNYMRFTQTDTSNGSFKTGEQLVNTPNHTANASAFYTFGPGRIKGLKLGATLVYLGDRYAGWNTDVQKVSGRPFTWRERRFAVDGYTTLDISAGYGWKKLSLMAKVSNVTNTLNWYVHENYSVNPIPPTQLMATVSYKF